MSPKLSTTKRERLYDLWRGDSPFPICNLCHLPIEPGQNWDESHNPLLPRALGGSVTGLAHRRCNRLHNNTHDTPLVAKNKRIHRKHIGAFKSRRPMPGGRTDPRKRTMIGIVVDRSTGEPWSPRR